MARIPCAIIADTMGLFYFGCRVLNPATSKSTAVRRLMVDTGAESTWIDATVLEGIEIEPRKKDLQFQLANGLIVTRSVGYAVLRVDKAETVDEVVFAQRGDLQLLGARALQGLNLQVDSRRKRLVAAGPIVSATAVPPRFGQLVQVLQEAPKNPGKPCKQAEEAAGYQIESTMNGA
jgi:predicted aspartyl protease